LKREPITALLSNDFQAGVAAAFPDVERLGRKLESLGAEATVMSGSGSAVVGLFRSGRRAEDAAAAVSAPDRAFAVRVLRRRRYERWAVRYGDHNPALWQVLVTHERAQVRYFEPGRG
jgi:4-diphosphocytidyl-2C-methyl-D-erythritol kinase